MPRGRQVAGGALLGFSLAWLAVGLVHEWSHPVAGWVPLPLMALLAATECRRVARGAGFDAGTRRFWGQLAVACALLGVAVVANAVDAVGRGAPSQRLGPVTLTLYLAVLAVALWALLRLPAWQRGRADWIRVGLDACIVLVTSGAFVWHFSLREHEVWMRQTGSAAAMLTMCVVGFVALAAFTKVVVAGAGHLDRRAVTIMATGTAASTVFGGLTPFLIDRPYLSTSFAAVSVVAFSIQVSAGRQLRSGETEPRPRRRSRRMNIVPYVAVGAADALLLLTGTTDGSEIRVMEVVAVLLTALVITRQIMALRENHRLVGRLEEYHEALAHRATHDSLTGIGNRAHVEQAAAGILGGEAPVHILLFDLDDFKAINDRLGHAQGDVLIRHLATRLEAALPAPAVLARLGGDEFVALLPGVGTGAVGGVLDGLLAALRKPVSLDGAEVLPKLSMGVTVGGPGCSWEELLRRVDVAMYAAKAAGGNRWTWYDPLMDTVAEETARLGADLRTALRDGQLYLLYQPIVALADGAVTGVETLLRWRHPEHGLVSPDVFIPLAERNGLIVELGEWVLEQACRQAAGWQRDHGAAAPGRVSVNVSARQLAEPGFVAVVEGILDRTGVDRGRLLIEVTETAVLSTDTSAAAIADLRRLGLQIALDDFGTGYSSLSILLDCPVDVLKVDKSFVSGASADGAGAVIVEQILGFTEGLRIQAVAEGVETAEQAARLHAAGYQYAQGFHFARPMTAADLEKLLTTAAAVSTR
ncbi:putative bifunctional diguanylate cyclase/phosphodiesterase [Actinoplanes sp. NPDC049265]|uniref:putative bifunctional diguanylate cyclase/phosphodiesterase n=1 Tax=Actinoplanes sp. NPDC049265 TaxID=3363902 RepID=UPI00371EB0E9